MPSGSQIDRCPSIAPWHAAVLRSVITLFRAILGGLDWEYAADALLPVGAFWVQARRREHE